MGDLFNYSAPGEEPSRCESMEHTMHDLVNEDTSGMADMEQLVSDSRRLTDGGFEKDVDAYCFYAQKSYKKGEQVIWASLSPIQDTVYCCITAFWYSFYQVHFSTFMGDM